MEVHFTPEHEARLTRSAEEEGRNADELVQEVLAQYLADEARLTVAVGSPKEAPDVFTARIIEDGYRQAERGDLMSEDQARSEIGEMKRNWREARASAR